MSEWQEIEQGLDGQTIAFFQDQTSGDEIEIRDQYEESTFRKYNPRSQPYKVVYDRMSGLPDHTLSDTFTDLDSATEYVEGITGIELENTETQ